MASASTPSQLGEPDAARSRPRTAAGGFADDFSLTVHRPSERSVAPERELGQQRSPRPARHLHSTTSPERLEHQGHALVDHPQPVITRENAARSERRSASQTSGGAAGDPERAHSTTRSRE